MNSKRFAVIGNPINHSLSPIIHQAFAQKTGMTIAYEKLLGSLEGFEQDVHHFFISGGQGLNVTLPFKNRAFSMADCVSERARIAKAANVLFYKEGLLHADNTDGIGLVRDLSDNIGLDLTGIKVVILGAGGATCGILHPLLTAGVSEITVLNRDKKKRKELSLHFKDVRFLSLDDKISPAYDLIIHATSAGYQDKTPLTLPADLWRANPLCYDLSYKTGCDETHFVQLAQEKNLRAYDGLGMLIEQAAEAFVIWNEVPRDELSTRSIRCLLGQDLMTLS